MKKKAGAKSTDPKDINTSAIINKSRVFRDVTLDLSKCRAAMIAILQATAIGVQFTDKEQTELFFSLTQLMHNQDPYIHRLLILLLKQIKIKPHDAIIITHSLSKDINGEVAMTQGHAIRCLCSLLDANSALTLEKFLKPAISSNNPYTSSSALCGALKIIEGGRKDAVLRWLYEIRQASNSTQRSVRFHALLLLHALRSDDLHASAQLSSTLEPSKSILEQCIQISIATQTLKLKQTDQVMNFLRQSINSNSPQTCLETIRKCGSYLPNESATAIFSFFGGSILRSFAAVRTIANSTNIQVYSSLLPQIIELTKHSNSSLAALASICVLRLGDESHMDIATKRILKNCKKWATPLLKSVAQEACVFAGKYKSDKLTDVAVLLLKYTNDKKSKFSILRSLLTTE
ncbi:Nonclathrin coat protein gamma - like protein, putative, partial [Trichomonas vaginalis G3]